MCRKPAKLREEFLNDTSSLAAGIILCRKINRLYFYQLCEFYCCILDAILALAFDNFKEKFALNSSDLRKSDRNSWVALIEDLILKYLKYIQKRRVFYAYKC